MFKPHNGTCGSCGKPRLIVVKRGLCDQCNYEEKEAKKNGRDSGDARIVNASEQNNAQDIEGYTTVFRAPIRKKALKKRRIGSEEIRKKVDFGKHSGLQGITKEHTLVYMKAFGYTIADYVPCEITGQRCNDIHHIYARGMGGSDLEDELYNRIENLMGLTREKHIEYGDKEQYYDLLIEKHFQFLSDNGVPFDKHFFEKWPK